MSAQAVTLRRSNHFRLLPSEEEEMALWTIGDGCAALYNELNYRRRSMWFTHKARTENKQYWDGGDLVARYASIIEASNAQQIQRRLNADWNTFFRLLEAKAKGKLPAYVKPRPPGYKKHRDGQRRPFIIVRNDRYRIMEAKHPDRQAVRRGAPIDHVSRITLPVPPKLREEGVRGLAVAFRGTVRWRGKPKAITRRLRKRPHGSAAKVWDALLRLLRRLTGRKASATTVSKTVPHGQGALRIWFDDADNTWRASQSVEASTRRSNPGPSRANSTHDLGVICLTTRIQEGEKQTVAYSGRALLSDWWYLNRRIARVASRLKTLNNKHTSRLLRHLYATRSRRHDHAVNAMLKHEVHPAVAFGDVTGRREGYRTGNPRLNEMIHLYWGFRKLYTRADELYEAQTGRGKVPRIDETDTSTRCPWCGSMDVTTRGRLFKCRRCGCEAHKDVVGSANIDAVRNSGGRVNGMMAHPLLLRWDRTLGVWKHKDRSQKEGENLPASAVESVKVNTK